MLSILKDPAGITGKTQHPWDLGSTLQENIARHLAGGGDCELWINGAVVDPLADSRLDMPPTLADSVMVVRRPGFGPEALIYWAVGLAIASAVVAYSLVPKVPSNATPNDSPNNKLTAQTNVARAYQAIPDVYGYRRCWPDLIQPSTVEYIDNIKYVTEWMCISRGIGTLSDVQYADTPIGDIAGASYEVFEPTSAAGYPELGSTTLLDVLETFASDDVNGQEITYPAAFAGLVRTGDFSAASGAASFTVTIPDTAALADLKSLAPAGTAVVAFSYGAGPTAFSQTCTVLAYSVAGGNATFTFSSAAWASAQSGSSINFTITPNGTSKITMGPYTLPIEGDRLRWNTVFLRGLAGSVVIRAEWWQIDANGAEIAGTRQGQDDTFTDSTFDQRFFTTEVAPASGAGRYRVQFTRQTAQIGTQGADVAKLEALYAVRHYAVKVLPGVTVIRITTKATLDATSFSDRKFNVRWLRHVRTLNSDALSASRNYARALAHIWTLSGNAIADLDTDKLAGINYRIGEESELLRFDGSLDDAEMSLGERMQLIANHARCVIWRDGLQWTVTREQAQSEVELQFDYRNLAAGGESAITYAAHLPASNDGVEIEYVDETDQNKKAYVRMRVDGGMPVLGASSNPKKLQLPGCTTYAQAFNRASLEAYRLLYQRTSVSDTALADATDLGLGALVRWIDPNDFAGDDGLQAGEVLSITDLTIETSEPINWKGEATGRILFTGDDGRVLGSPVRCYPSGAGVVLEWVPAGVYVATDSRQLGSRYAFAVGLTDAELESAGLYTTTQVKPAPDGTASVALVSYDARLFTAD